MIGNGCNKMFYITLFFVLVSFSGFADAGELYQWKDDQGVVHFTDNIALVPAEYRGDYKPELSINEGPSKLDGKAIWDSKCSSCHFLGEEKGSGLNLSSVLINQASGMVVDMSVIQYTLSNVFGDSPSRGHRGVSSRDIKVLSKYLHGEQDDLVRDDPSNY